MQPFLLRLKSVKVQGKVLGSLVILLPLGGCESINVNRLAYDFLRQEDCRRNDVDVYEFCSRTFVFEYDEYEQLRQEYIRTEAEKFASEEKNRLALQNAAWQ